MNTSARFWDKKAAKYAESAISDEVSYQKKLAETQDILSADMQVLEFGCGTGSTAIYHAPHVKHVTALDISNNMLEIGRGNAAVAGIDNIDFIHSGLIEFNARDAQFDVVLALNVIHLIADRQNILAEVARILKPGGSFVSSTVCLGSSPFRFIKYAVPVGKALGLMPDVFIMHEDQWVNEITSSGFTVKQQWHHGKDSIAVFVIAQKI